MDREIYEKINQYDNLDNLVLLTVIKGADKGEKLLLAGEEILYSNAAGGFLENNYKKLFPFEQTQTKCFEEREIFLECIGKQKHLVICGAGHVSKAVIMLAKSIGFYVTVIEDRPLFADMARKQQADVVICDDFVKALKELDSDKDTYFVIATRGHRWDKECLYEILQKKYAYVGMMGSQRRVLLLKENLLEEGISKDRLNELHSPIGISIGAETPEEIAVSIIAEIVQEKNKIKKITGYHSKLISSLTSEDNREMILATIVKRRGSAPREIGTKMLVFANGETVGTIGGGCMESEIIRKCRVMLQDKESECKICEVDMTGRDAEEEGMVCGGTIEVLLES
jgi:xanthine dehydrogenase accessory factor